jgi:hypothetical protein
MKALLHVRVRQKKAVMSEERESQWNPRAHDEVAVSQTSRG